jgi:hypothetical protein
MLSCNWILDQKFKKSKPVVNIKNHCLANAILNFGLENLRNLNFKWILAFFNSQMQFLVLD